MHHDRLANTFNCCYFLSTYCVPANAKYFTYIISIIFKGSFAQRDSTVFGVFCFCFFLLPIT